MTNSFNLEWIDYAIMIIYFLFVLGIGWALKKYMKDAKAFLEAGRSMPAWVAGLAFIATNLGALEVMGMAGSGAKYGMLTTHFYWIGAIPAMVFLALFIGQRTGGLLGVFLSIPLAGMIVLWIHAERQQQQPNTLTPAADD